MLLATSCVAFVWFDVVGCAVSGIVARVVTKPSIKYIAFIERSLLSRLFGCVSETETRYYNLIIINLILNIVIFMLGLMKVYKDML